MRDKIVCPNCGAYNDADLSAIAAGARPGCTACGSGLVLDQDGFAFSPFSQSDAKGGVAKENFFKRYWRGDISLPVSYWGISFLSNITFFAISSLTYTYFDRQKSFFPVGIWLAFTLLWFSFLTIYTWQLVGLWRSAKNYQKIHLIDKKYIYGSIAKFAAFIGFLNMLQPLAVTVFPQFLELTSIAFADDPTIPPYKLTISHYGTELKIEGGLKYGIVKDVERILSASNDIKTVNLESVGGRIGVAEDLYDLFVSRGLNTVTNYQCQSACALVFAAGKNRWLGYNAKLGFHSGAFPGLENEASRSLTDHFIKKIAQKNGTPLLYLNELQSHPNSSMYYPQKVELFKNNYITSYVSPAASSHDSIEKAVKKNNVEFIKELPKRIDDYTTISELNINGSQVNIVYDVTPDVEEVFKQMDVRMKTSADQKRYFCEDKDLKLDLLEGITYILTYRNNLSKRSFFEVTISDCK